MITLLLSCLAIGQVSMTGNGAGIVFSQPIADSGISFRYVTTGVVASEFPKALGFGAGWTVDGLLLVQFPASGKGIFVLMTDDGEGVLFRESAPGVYDGNSIYFQSAVLADGVLIVQTSDGPLTLNRVVDQTFFVSEYKGNRFIFSDGKLVEINRGKNVVKLEYVDGGLSAFKHKTKKLKLFHNITGEIVGITQSEKAVSMQYGIHDPSKPLRRCLTSIDDMQIEIATVKTAHGTGVEVDSVVTKKGSEITVLKQGKAQK